MALSKISLYFAKKFTDMARIVMTTAKRKEMMRAHKFLSSQVTMALHFQRNSYLCKVIRCLAVNKYGGIFLNL